MLCATGVNARIACAMVPPLNHALKYRQGLHPDLQGLFTLEVYPTPRSITNDADHDVLTNAQWDELPPLIVQFCPPRKTRLRLACFPHAHLEPARVRQAERGTPGLPTLNPRQPHPRRALLVQVDGTAGCRDAA